MSYGTYLTTTIIFNRQTFDSLWQVREALDKVNEELADAKRMIHELTMITDPSKFMAPDELERSTPYEWVSARTKDLLDTIEDLAAEKYRLEILEQEWNNCHTSDGRPINAPYDTDEFSFLDGDYLKGGTSMEELNKLKEDALRKEDQTAD